MPEHHSLVWRHTEDGLALSLGCRVGPVPVPVDTWFIGLGGLGTSADSAADLLDLEGHLRADFAMMLARVRQAETSINNAYRDTEAPTQWRDGWSARQRRRSATDALRRWFHQHCAQSDQLDDYRHVRQAVRRAALLMGAAVLFPAGCTGGPTATARASAAASAAEQRAINAAVPGANRAQAASYAEFRLIAPWALHGPAAAKMVSGDKVVVKAGQR